ncbi:MAG: M1 family aminopeptidase, partial [Pyrinomonadaceae bacterium]
MRQADKQRCGLRRATAGRSIFVFAALCCVIAAAVQSTASAQEQRHQQSSVSKTASRTRYRIKLALDFDGRSYTGTELVRWTNRDDQPASVLYFHLYPNMRAAALRGGASAATNSSQPGGDASDEPRLEVTEARAVATNTALNYALDDQGVTLRVNLRESVAAGASVDVMLKFKGSVPEIDSEETGLVTHVLQQVGAALRSEREMRRARDINFRSRGLMLLGSAYPVLANREGSDWKRKVEATIGDMFFADVADYEVSIDAPPEVALFTSGREREPEQTIGAAETNAPRAREFEGVNMREFAIVAGRGLRSEERQVGEVKVRSVFFADHERVGQRVLANASEAVRVYVARFGAMPYRTVTVVDAPLVAGLGSAEFAGLGVIASAFYVDFDSPLIRNLPEIIREQRASVESSLEWTVAHMIAHQWWGAGVGNDPERDPVLDEALANWSALLYYTDTYDEERAEAALDDQLRGVYKVYRTFGGEDMEAARPAREYRNFFQYSAIISAKGALMFEALLDLMGEEKFFAALRSYYKANLFEVAEMDDLRGAFIAEAPLAERRA